APSVGLFIDLDPGIPGSIGELFADPDRLPLDFGSFRHRCSFPYGFETVLTFPGTPSEGWDPGKRGEGMTPPLGKEIYREVFMTKTRSSSWDSSHSRAWPGSLNASRARGQRSKSK